MAEIHITDLSTYCRCRRAWDFSSLMRQSLEPAIPALPLFMGLGFHRAMEYGYKGSIGQPFAHFDVEAGRNAMLSWGHARTRKASEYIGHLWAEEIGKMDDGMTLLNQMVEHYGLWVEEMDSHLEILGTEKTFSIPLPGTDLEYAGRWDGIVRAADDNIYVLEFKTTASMSSTRLSSVFRGLQPAAYVWAARQFGYNAKGVLYRIANKHWVDEPTPLRRGGYSVAKNQWISVEWIDRYATMLAGDRADGEVAAIEDLVAIAASMRDVRELASSFITRDAVTLANKFFMTKLIRKGDNKIDNFLKVITTIGREMADENQPIFAVPDWNCTYCKFQHPCDLLEAGLDEHAELSLQAEYAPRFYWDDYDDAE